MDDSDRPAGTHRDVPEELLPVLRAAAEYGLELAADNGAGDWNEEIRGGILEAARIVEVFDIGCLGDARLLRLADLALAMRQPRAPQTMEEVADLDCASACRWWGLWVAEPNDRSEVILRVDRPGETNDAPSRRARVAMVRRTGGAPGSVIHSSTVAPPTKTTSASKSPSAAAAASSSWMLMPARAPPGAW